MSEDTKHCPLCGQRMKVLYERHGAKATFRATGDLKCSACGLLLQEAIVKYIDWTRIRIW